MSPLRRPPASSSPTDAEPAPALSITPEQLQEIRTASLHLLGEHDEDVSNEDFAMGALAALARLDHTARALNDIRADKVVPTDKYLRELAAQLRDASTAMLDGSQRLVSVLRDVERGKAPLRVVK